MILTLSLETGDITSPDRERRRFQVEVDRPPTEVCLRFSSVEGKLAIDDWPLLVEQVKAQELVKRHFPDTLPPPLGRRDVLAVVRQINSTPTFQLFLAGIDIVETINLATDSPAETVMRRLSLLDKWMPSLTGAGGIFFVPDQLVRQHSERAVQELLTNNKLCMANLGGTRRLYVPYATPVGFIVRVGTDAERLWDEVRSIYYAFRRPA